MFPIVQPEDVNQTDFLLTYRWQSEASKRIRLHINKALLQKHNNLQQRFLTPMKFFCKYSQPYSAAFSISCSVQSLPNQIESRLSSPPPRVPWVPQI